MSEVEEVENLLKKVLPFKERTTIYDGMVLLNYKGIFWNRINDLSYSVHVLCLNCHKAIWLCGCYPAMHTPKQCTCTPQPHLHPALRSPKIALQAEGYQLTEEQICGCTLPTDEELITLFKKRVEYAHRGGTPHYRYGWQKVYGEQITYLLSEVSTLKQEVKRLKETLAETLEELAKQ